MTTERSLADVTTVDTTPPITPQDFDFAAFVDGARPTRRSVRLFPRGDLIARLEELADQIDTADDTANVDALIEEFVRIRDQFQAGVWFTVEKRSSEWVRRFRTDVEEHLGYQRTKNPGGQLVLTTLELATITVHQLAEQIIVPTGVTVDDLWRLFETNEGEFNKLAVALTEVNNDLAEKAKVLTRDFSRKRSTAKPTPAG